jgi:hypothetical protein
MKRLFSFSTFAVVFSLLLASVMAERSLAATGEGLKTAMRRLDMAQAGIAKIREILSSGHPPSAADVLYIALQREIAITNMQALTITSDTGVPDPQSKQEKWNERERIRLAVDIALLKVDAEANRLSHTQVEFNERVDQLRTKAFELFQIVRGPSGKALQELVRAIDRIPRVDENENNLLIQQERQLRAIKAIPNRSSSSTRLCESWMMTDSLLRRFQQGE